VKSPKPLDNFPFLRSRDVEEVRDALGRVYAKPALMPARNLDGFNAIINVCRLKDTGLTYGTFGAAVGFEFPATDFFSQLLPIRGTGEIVCGRAAVALAAGAGAMMSSDSPHKVSFSSDYEHLMLQISAQALTDKLAAMTGTTINETLRMEPLQNSEHSAAQMLQQYLPLLVETLSAVTPPFPDWWITQTEQLLMVLVLYGYRHNYSHLLTEETEDAAPLQIRQAEEYIEANAQHGVTLEELASITGVSAFSLFRSFKKYRGYSPQEFLTRVRLKHGKSLA
jgi:AraC-binding-like domain